MTPDLAPYANAWKPYWDKWKATEPIEVVTCDYRPNGQHVTGPVYDIHSFAGRWLVSEMPDPQAIAEYLDRILRLVCSGMRLDRTQWYRLPGWQVVLNPPIDDLPVIVVPEGAKLIVRHPWEFEVDSDWRTMDRYLTVYGRFGCVPAECSTEKMLEGAAS